MSRSEHKNIRIAKIVNTHGVRGEVKALPLSDFKDRFSLLKEVKLELGDRELKVVLDNVRWKRDNLILKFKEFDTLDEVEQLKNSYVVIDKANTMPLPENSFYQYQIIGLDVHDINTQEKIGSVVGIIETSANDVYIVKESETSRKEILVPAIKDVVKEVHLEENKMIVDLPEGLTD